ncbi:MAG: GntR family transcriptional regulator [Desulfobacterales bacterium]|nr:GntR family transcriptional regulator [Desulfobacterales bacterium]
MPFQLKTSVTVPNSLTDMAYEAIKESILTTNFDNISEDRRLDEKILVQSLGISRTPVREATNRLIAEGFLKVIPRKGVFVVKKSPSEITEIQLIRSVIEGLAGRLATKNLTRKDIVYMRSIFAPFQNSDPSGQRREYHQANIRFHEFIVQKSQCGKLIEMASNLADHIRMIRFRTSFYPDRLASSLDQHMKIIDTFEKGDAELAETLLRKHIDESMEYLQKMFSEAG